MYSLFRHSLTESKRKLFWLVMCVITKHILKTRRKVFIKQTVITTFKNIISDLKKRKEIHRRTGNDLSEEILKHVTRCLVLIEGTFLCVCVCFSLFFPPFMLNLIKVVLGLIENILIRC